MDILQMIGALLGSYWLYLLLALLLINLVTFLMYREDKQAALAGEWRTPEGTLLRLALFGGTPAAYYACHRFRHKTSKASFMNYLFGIALFQAMVLGAGTVLLV